MDMPYYFYPPHMCLQPPLGLTIPTTYSPDTIYYYLTKVGMSWYCIIVLSQYKYFPKKTDVRFQQDLIDRLMLTRKAR